MKPTKPYPKPSKQEQPAKPVKAPHNPKPMPKPGKPMC